MIQYVFGTHVPSKKFCIHWRFGSECYLFLFHSLKQATNHREFHTVVIDVKFSCYGCARQIQCIPTVQLYCSVIRFTAIRYRRQKLQCPLNRTSIQNNSVTSSENDLHQSHFVMILISTNGLQAIDILVIFDAFTIFKTFSVFMYLAY